MSDTRNWLQKFIDQCSFGSLYTIQLTPEQVAIALRSIALRKGWRARRLLEELEIGKAHVTSVKSQDIITVTVDTSDAIFLKDLLAFTQSSIVSRTENNGFWSTTTRYGK